MTDPKPGIVILEEDPELYGAKKSLLRFAILNEVRALVDELDPRIGGPKHSSIIGGGGWPDREREESARVEIGLLLQMLPRIDEGPF